MSDGLNFAIVIHPNTTKTERVTIYSLILFIFLPFIYGIFVQEAFYCLSLPIGFVGIIIFNYFTDFKFTTTKIIQNNKFIHFLENELKIQENHNFLNYNWNELDNLEIHIIAYKNQRKDEDNSYQGIENYIIFTYQDITFKYLFYIEKSNQLNDLNTFFKEKILPNLYYLKKIKNETIIISRLEYSDLQKFKAKYNINRYTDYVYYN